MVPLALVPVTLLAAQAAANAAPAENAKADSPAIVAIAPAAWMDALEPWAAHRRATLRVELASLEDALASETGADAPERLKRFLYRAWKERGARHALLVGDADTFPVRFMVLDRVTAPAFDVAFYPCDLYYADVAREDGSFDDWNAESEGASARYFGEVRGEKHKDGPINFDRVSYAPELGVGRWPVSERGELAAVVAKTLAWEARVAAGGAGAPRALVAHADGWIDARERARSVGRALAARGLEVDLRLYGSERAPSPAGVAEALRAGVAFAAHLGHGSPDTWEGCLGPAEMSALAEGPPAILTSVGCSTGKLCVEPPYEAYVDVDGIVHAGTNAGEAFATFPPPPASLQPGRFDASGLGERLLLMPSGGAAAYIGCCTGSQPCAVTLLEGLAAALSQPETARLGDAWRAAVAHYVEAERLMELVPTEDWYPPSVFFQGMKFLVLGDPALTLP